MEADYLTILIGDAIEQLRTLPAESVHCCVCSPPYWGLRDYGTAAWEGGEAECDHKYSVSSPYNENFNERWGNASGAKKQESERHEVSYKSDCGKCGAKRIDSQLGLEKTPEEYVAKMVEVFREVRRVLRRDGTLWLNLGDSFVGGNNTNSGGNANFGSQPGRDGMGETAKSLWKGLPAKNLVGIPWRVAFALQADGWWLRSDIIWAKPNPMPESVADRPTKSHEYIFLLTKSANYFWDADAVKENVSGNAHKRQPMSGAPASMNFKMQEPGLGNRNNSSFQSYMQDLDPELGRNRRSVWTIATQPYPEAHFATFPEELPKLCILAGTSAKGCCDKCGAPWERIVKKSEGTAGKSWHDHKNDLQVGQRGGNEDHRRAAADGYEGDYKVETLGWQPTCSCRSTAVTWDSEPALYTTVPCTVLDPFAGSGTTGAVALELGRKAVLIELNPKYVELIRQRCNVTLGLMLA